MNLNFNEIEIYKTITVSGNIGNNANTFSAYINVEFIPDEIILKYVAKYDDDQAASDLLDIISSDLIDNQVIFSYPSSMALYEMCNTPFRNQKPIQGLYTFTITQIDGSLPSNFASFNSFYSFTFLFVKYKHKNNNV